VQDNLPTQSVAVRGSGVLMQRKVLAAKRREHRFSSRDFALSVGNVRIISVEEFRGEKKSVLLAACYCR